jgi:hypothetical protein
MAGFSKINAKLPDLDLARATDAEIVTYLNLQGVKVVSPEPGKFRMLHRSRQVALKATLFSQALKEACTTLTK